MQDPASREKEVEGVKKENNLLTSPKLESDGFEEVSKDGGLPEGR